MQSQLASAILYIRRVSPSIILESNQLFHTYSSIMVGITYLHGLGHVTYFVYITLVFRPHFVRSQVTVRS